MLMNGVELMILDINEFKSWDWGIKIKMFDIIF
jgi:hypothetical protein